MKAIITIIFAMCLLLSGCTSQPEVTTAPTAPSTTVATEPATEATTEPTTVATEATTEPTTVATEAPVLYRHPFTGAALDAPWAVRPTAVVFNNLKDCLPQHGVSQADVLFEVETEGGITRMLGIFSDISSVGAIGPVRSTRTFYNNLALSFDAPLIHCGGSDFALQGWYSSNGDSISGWEHINEQSNGSYFYRDADRRQAGFSMEHTLFTNGSNLAQALVDKGYHIPKDDGYQYGMTFGDDIRPNGESAGKITVTFRGGKTTVMHYDPQLNIYLAEQYNQPYVDGNTGDTLTFSNVIVVFTTQSFFADSSYTRSFYELSGSGEGYLATGGTIVPIVWNRDTLRSSMYYTYPDGTPVVLNTGKTYVAIAATSGSVDFEPVTAS